MKYDRFDLEVCILDCWRIIEDVALLEEQGANTADMVSLANTYEFKFKKMWSVMEEMIKDGQFAPFQHSVKDNQYDNA